MIYDPNDWLPDEDNETCEFIKPRTAIIAFLISVAVVIILTSLI